MLDLTCCSRRVIAMLLLICVLGLQQSSACSTSHEQVRHSHRVDSASHTADLHDGGSTAANDIRYAGQHGHSHDDNDGGGDHDGHGTHDEHGGHGKKFSHVHDHNPGDHTHDIPLRPTIKPVTALPPCGWQPALLAMPAVRHPLPLERPPRHLTA